MSLILIYPGLEEETLDQKSPGPPGWGLMQWASSSLITKKQEMLKKTKHQGKSVMSSVHALIKHIHKAYT